MPYTSLLYMNTESTATAVPLQQSSVIIFQRINKYVERKEKKMDVNTGVCIYQINNYSSICDIIPRQKK
jgi:hypothetical protein